MLFSISVNQPKTHEGSNEDDHHTTGTGDIKEIRDVQIGIKGDERRVH